MRMAVPALIAPFNRSGRLDGRSAIRSAARSIRDPCYRSRLTALSVAPTAAPVINLAFAWQADGRLASTTDLVGNRTPAAATATLMKASLATTANQINGTTTLTGAPQRTLTYKTGGDLVQDVHVAGITYGYIYNAAKADHGQPERGDGGLLRL